MQNPWAANKNAANSANASRKHRTHDRKRQTPDWFRATRYRVPHPAIGRANSLPQRGRARRSLRNEENSGIERARILDPGPALMRWDACRDWHAFPRASDACDRDGSLLLLKLIVHPKGTRQVESVSAYVPSRYTPPRRPTAKCGG